MAAAESKADANQQRKDRRNCGAFAKAVVKFIDNLFISFLWSVCTHGTAQLSRTVAVNFRVSDFYLQMSTGSRFGYNYERMAKPSHEDLSTVMTESRCYWPL